MSASCGKDITIVGGGIIGLSSAFHLIRQGCDVTVISHDPVDDTTACGSAGATAAIVPASKRDW